MLAEAGLPPLKYEFIGGNQPPGSLNFVRAIFNRFPATPQADEGQKKEILDFCSVPRSKEEIQLHLGLKHREHFRLEILQPLLKKGLLIPTIPDKPNSPNQKYVRA